MDKLENARKRKRGKPRLGWNDITENTAPQWGLSPEGYRDKQEWKRLTVEREEREREMIKFYTWL